MYRQSKINIRCVGLVLAAFFGFYMSMACGGGGSASDSSTSGPAEDAPAATVTVSISGTVDAPSANSNVAAKGVFKKKAVASAGLTATCHTLDGESLGSTTITSDGVFKIDADVDVLKPDDATGSSWSTPIVCSAKSDDGKTDLRIFATASVEEGATSEISIGTITVESTITTSTMLKGSLACDPTTGTKCSVPAGLNLACLSAGLGGVWSQVVGGSNENNIMNLAGTMKSFVNNLYMGGVHWANLECKTSATCIAQLMNCTLKDADIASMISAAQTVDPELVGASFEVVKSGLIESCTATESVRGIVAGNLAGSADAATACTNIVNGGRDRAKIMLEPLLVVKSNNFANITNIFPPKTWQFVDGIIENTSDFTKLRGGGPTVLGILENQWNNHNTFDNFPIQGSAPKLFSSIVEQASGLTYTQQNAFAKGWHNAIRVNSVDAFCPNSVCGDAATIGYLGAAYIESGFDFQNHDYVEDKNTYHAIPNLPAGERAPVWACASITSAAGRFDCYKNVKGDDEEGNVNNDNNNDSGDSGICNAALLIGNYCYEIVDQGQCGQSYERHFEFGQSRSLTPINGARYSYYNCYWAEGSGCSYRDGATIDVGNCIANGNDSGGIYVEAWVEPDPPASNNYWDAIWYSNNANCLSNLSVTNGQDVLSVARFDPPANQSGSGSCQIYNSVGSQALGCTYSGAGAGDTAGANTSISIMFWAGLNGGCAVTLTKTQPQEDPQPAVSNYWNGQWYSNDIACISGPLFVGGESASSSIDPPEGQTDAGTCVIYNASNVAATGCGYAGAGIGNTAANTTVISVTGWSGPSGNCSATLTKTLPTPLASPTNNYWDGTWVHTQSGTYTCESDTVSISNRLWEVAPATFISFSRPDSFISADTGTLTLPGDFTVEFSYERPLGTAVVNVESGSTIVIPAINTPQGICSMRLVRQ